MTLFVLGCSSAFVYAAPSGPVQFGLVDVYNNVFCDYVEFSYGSALASGKDVNEPCGFPDGSMLGVTVTVPASTGVYVSGPAVVVGDSAADVFGYSGVQIMLILKTRASNTKYGWAELFNIYDAYDVYLADWGYLTKHNGPLGPLAEGASTKSLASTVQGKK
jgi:hypothetical protein